ncbi:hypothetical protein KOW79_002588 [Hemibagrus wyckioides]|uniref:Mitochondrial antiviral-signaling protein n=1 Tax=Hemibagrus wyckioides TaxID=337641 RepID=A0A9D3P405_9TELE|nr:mitochondrial antiviral-signaling protein [Hemibagrus wyckioides]XP_058241429.1 mitochondrial antiviral-signaling protein [Hemibagrus wyckioides]KAG7334181.1 hypothetical protein KOW79_002588 [Hemibagrus wyckioides]
MAYACDKLYNEVIRKMMAELATNVKVREIIVHLPCLTISDREEIDAKRETSGNYNAMVLLLDSLRRRENWPDQFILALKNCEQWTLADVISKAYDSIRGIHTTDTFDASVSPAAPPAPAPAPAAAAPIPAPSQVQASEKVTTVTIHKVPNSTPPLLTPTVETEAPASVSAPDAQVHTPSASAHPAEPPLSVLAPDARPPSPVSAPILTPPIRQSEVPVGTRESSKLGTSEALTEARALGSVQETVTKAGASVHTPRELAHLAEPPLSVLAPEAMPSSPGSAPKVTPSVEQSEVPVSSRDTPTLDISGGLTNAALSGPSSPAPTLPANPTPISTQVNKPATTSQSSASKKVPVAVSIAVKHPIQDTDPPGVVLARDLQNNPAINQVGERVHTALLPNCQTQEPSHGTAQVSPSASSDAVAGRLTNIPDENEENFSKPGVLRGEEPLSVSSDLSLQISNITMERSPIQPARPQAVPNSHRGDEQLNETVSVTTDNLMIISSTATLPSQCVSDSVAPVQNTIPRTLRNGFPEEDSSSYPHQPVEDYYESLQMEPGTREHVVEFSEEPSLQNLNDQPSSMVRQTTTCLSHNSETESLVWSVHEAQPNQEISQSKQTRAATSSATHTGSASATFQESELNVSGQTNIVQSEQTEESHGVLHRFQSNSHLIAAAAIGITALFVALKLKD